MTLRQYLAIMGFGTCLCWAAWFFVIVNVDPFHANLLNFIFFYLTLLFALIGTLSLTVFAAYYWFSREIQPLFRHVQRSFRDAFFASLLLVGLLYLQGRGWLTIWNTSVFIIFMLVASIFFISMRPVSATLPVRPGPARMTQSGWHPGGRRASKPSDNVKIIPN